MPTHDPRWEWRTFGESFGEIEQVLAASTTRRVEETDELYLLSADGDNVKIRAQLLDIKALLEVDRRGLQQWRPVLKVPFPLAVEQVETTFEALRLPVRDLGRESFDQVELLDAVNSPPGAVRLVTVHKRRGRDELDGCMVELTDLDVGELHIRSLAIEGTDPDAVWECVTKFDLSDRVNTSVPRGLFALVDGMQPRGAVIDVGTNSVKFHVGELGDDGTWTRLVDRAEVTRLGDGMATTGEISPAAVERTIVAMSGMVAEARQLGAQAIVAVGTAGMRSAGNRAEVVEALEAGTGVIVDVVSGEEESRLAYLAVRSDLTSTAGALVVFDTGGGSSQFTFGQGSAIDERFSVDVGAVRYTERFGLDAVTSAETLAAALDAIRSDLDRVAGRPSPDALVGMGGAMTNLTAVSLALDPYDPDAVDGATLHVDEIDRQIELYRTSDAEARRSIVGLQPARAEVILAGACIVRVVMDLLGQQSVRVSDRGLRHGLLHEHFGPATPQG